ncbi:MAG: YHS domain-containing (seleno)protein [Spirochaetota bacterium]
MKQNPKISKIAIFYAIIAFGLFTNQTTLPKQEEKAKEGEVKTVAIMGYDTVAYFTQKEAVKGKKELFVVWNQKLWLFSNLKNRDLFQASPEKYVPQYGGQCAFAMSTGKKVPAYPERWSVENGKLYLNSNRFASFLWSIVPSRVEKADKNWQALQSSSKK